MTSHDQSHKITSSQGSLTEAEADEIKLPGYGELPPIFVSATHFRDDDLHKLEEDLTDRGATLTYDANEAEIILTKVNKKARILFDLRAKGIWAEEAKARKPSGSQEIGSLSSVPLAKKRKLEELPESPGNDAIQAIVIDDDTASEDDDAHVKFQRPTSLIRRTITVVKVDWFAQSQVAGHPLPLQDFTSFQGYKLDRPPQETDTPSKNGSLLRSPALGRAEKSNTASLILKRAKHDASRQPSSTQNHLGKRQFVGRHQHTVSTSASAAGSTEAQGSQLSRLLQQNTTGEEDSSANDLPDMPQWVRENVKYACQRSTPKTSPNDPFIDQLKKIKLARLLTNDEIGVRAYSTSIASLAAYPYKIHNPREILALPGCEAKIANLFIEWSNTGIIAAVSALDSSPDLEILHLFYNIWGVGATTAREFYFDKGWKDLDDIVEFGWSMLTRVQQIGVKFYDEFLDPIPRTEVAAIGAIIHRHAVKVRDDKVQSMLVGGYRRGKEACGDVDIIVSHPDEKQTAGLVTDIVSSLEEEGWITHTLLLSLHSTNRGQQTLTFRTGGGGHGFDTLDKALVVWQDPTWPTQARDLSADPGAKNPNIHRRVDIIVSPWRTVGCAVVGWSGGTTFERDLRRYAKSEHGWKFDSSGVRSRVNGEVIDVEGYFEGGSRRDDTNEKPKGRAQTMEEAEKRVFDGMGLEWRGPEERCTG